jgi:hypothetical protein
MQEQFLFMMIGVFLDETTGTVFIHLRLEYPRRVGRAAIPATATRSNGGAFVPAHA